MNIIKGLIEPEEYPFKNRISLFLCLLNILIVVIGSFFLVSMVTMLKGEEKQQKPQLSVSGEGKVFVKPDIATFNVSVINNGARIGDTQNENATRSNAVVGFLKQKGVQEKDIKTINYSVEPQYQYDNGRPCPIILGSNFPCSISSHLPPRIVSYKVYHSLEVKVRDLNKVDDLLQGVISAGGNEVGSVAFTVDDEKAAMIEARKLAIEDAKQKAQILARDLGIRLKKIVNFSESGGAPVYYGRMLEAKSADGGAASAPQVQAGEQEIRSNVAITYEFR